MSQVIRNMLETPDTAYFQKLYQFYFVNEMIDISLEFFHYYNCVIVSLNFLGRTSQNFTNFAFLCLYYLPLYWILDAV